MFAIGPQCDLMDALHSPSPSNNVDTFQGRVFQVKTSDRGEREQVV
eukprot:CAMPEP_0201547428 /NCGR_PEP_ID=MMETSP0173_2-20130828/3898_1 /ASSEMBLY_ACC=CAM_ASM_000268 /TAXON_ID=218659 /ORGANISM="Vexillifera sp., Strain DIVA3 564/2" /LENGTH=45 /DNA_ID= /DNA_START= /DNA_END= /DNA_ORIENTATION=